MWLGRCWVCHVGDTATNMTLALWMWNNTWQAELLISNHLLSWYASGNCCTTVFVQHCLYTLGHHNVKCYRLEKNHCCLWCIRPRTVQLSQILHFCAFFFNLRAVGAHFKQFLLNTRLQFVRSVAGVHLFFLADLFSVTWAHFGDMSYVKGWAAADVISNHSVSNRAKRMMFLLGYLYSYLIFVIFFTLAKFLENKIYTEKRQFFALNL